MREAAKFEERSVVTATYRRDRDAVGYQWARTRDAMLRSLQRHYGPRFPDAMMRIVAWIETEETWWPEPEHPTEAVWTMMPQEDRPLVLRLKVMVRKGNG